MSDHTLHNCRILVAEDEYLLASELELDLTDAGAIVLGPIGTIDHAVDLIRSEKEIDGAILDVNLGGELIFPVADLLIERGVPIVFTTGYDASIIPPHLKQVVRCEKPINITRIAQAIGRLIHA